MSYAQNSTVLESTTSYDTIWSDTDWKKTYKYVSHDSIQCNSGNIVNLPQHAAVNPDLSTIKLVKNRYSRNTT